MRNLSIGILLALATVGAASASTRPHPENLFVKMKSGQPLAQSSLIKSAKSLVGGLYLVKARDLQNLKAELKKNSDVEYVENDTFSGPRIMPKHEPLDLTATTFAKSFEAETQFNDPFASQLWAFNSKAGMNVLDAYAALPTHAPKEVIVAVVDTGVDHKHEDLKDIMWSNAKEIAGNNIDDDNNGYIDDIHGINTLVRDSQGRATMDTMASHWHGTHVSGTIAAAQNNATGIMGVASNVKIMALRTVPDNADELDSDIIEAYLYAAKHGAKVINCSFGKAKNEGGMAVRDVINEIGTKYGVLVIASAGNDSMGPFSWHDNDVDPKYPAAFDSENLLVVASTTNSGTLSGFSNIGPLTVDVAAPGSNIYSTMPGNKYGMASGTSMASPNVSGVAAMILGYYPNLKGKALKSTLITTVTKVPGFEGKMVSGGRVNMKASLDKAAK
jgi:thermitase